MKNITRTLLMLALLALPVAHAQSTDDTPADSNLTTNVANDLDDRNEADFPWGLLGLLGLAGLAGRNRRDDRVVHTTTNRQ